MRLTFHGQVQLQPSRELSEKPKQQLPNLPLVPLSPSSPMEREHMELRVRGHCEGGAPHGSQDQLLTLLLETERHLQRDVTSQQQLAASSEVVMSH